MTQQLVQTYLLHSVLNLMMMQIDDFNDAFKVVVS